jgi:glucose dehydrogenase
MTLKLPDRAMRIALAVVLFLSGVKLLEPPGANVIVIGVSAAALLAGLVAAARRWLSPRPEPAAAAAGSSRTGDR